MIQVFSSVLCCWCCINGGKPAWKGVLWIKKYVGVEGKSGWRFGDGHLGQLWAIKACWSQYLLRRVGIGIKLGLVVWLGVCAFTWWWTTLYGKVTSKAKISQLMSLSIWWNWEILKLEPWLIPVRTPILSIWKCGREGWGKGGRSVSNTRIKYSSAMTQEEDNYGWCNT